MYRRNLTIKSTSSTFLICRPELEGVQHYDACTIGHAILYHPHLSRLKTLQTPNQFPCSNCSHCSHCSHCSRVYKRKFFQLYKDPKHRVTAGPYMEGRHIPKPFQYGLTIWKGPGTPSCQEEHTRAHCTDELTTHVMKPPTF
jgi:hypothetical protein